MKQILSPPLNLLNLLPESAVSPSTQLANLPMACYNDHSLR